MSEDTMSITLDYSNNVIDLSDDATYNLTYANNIITISASESVTDLDLGAGESVYLFDDVDFSLADSVYLGENANTITISVD